MPQIGWFEILVIVLIAIIFIGPKDFPFMVKKIGKWIGSAKRYFSDFQKEITDILEIVEKNRGKTDKRLNRSSMNITDASKSDLIKLSKTIEKEMKSAADFLEFELAARLRDELKELKKEIQELSE